MLNIHIIIHAFKEIITHVSICLSLNNYRKLRSRLECVWFIDLFFFSHNNLFHLTLSVSTNNIYILYNGLFVLRVTTINCHSVLSMSVNNNYYISHEHCQTSVPGECRFSGWFYKPIALFGWHLNLATCRPKFRALQVQISDRDKLLVLRKNRTTHFTMCSRE